MRVCGSYLTTMSSSVAVMAATSQACWPSFLWGFLRGEGTRLRALSLGPRGGERRGPGPAHRPPPGPGPSRVVHEVVDLPHGHAAHVHEEHKPQKDEGVLGGQPEHELQVERVQFCQQKLGDTGGSVASRAARRGRAPRAGLTTRMMPHTASQRRRLEAGFHSKRTQL